MGEGATEQFRDAGQLGALGALPELSKQVLETDMTHPHLHKNTNFIVTWKERSI